MNKKIIVFIIITILIFSAGCEGDKGEENVPAVYSVIYDHDEKENIFGELNDEEIRNIIDKLLTEMENNTEKDEIIEKVFNESGIENPPQLEAAKTKLIFSDNE